MVFNSAQYVLFLPIVLGLYWLIRGRRPQNTLLLAASYVFYGSWDVRFLGLMILSTLTDFGIGRWLGVVQDERKRKRIFFLSLAINLGILGTFKYFNFFADSFAGLLRDLGLEADAPTLRIIVPIGISFYTFHGISYTFDVFRRKIQPAHSLLDFAVFIAFFPQLVAGPIGRAEMQLPQFEQPRVPPTTEKVRSALFLILLGLFKKIVIADALGPYVDQAFVGARSAGWLSLLLGAYGFMLQIYGDFSGYSDIARGSSRLFGIELLRNFDQPFLSRSMSEVWRRWHISLSSWLRDYLYIPLGGSRNGRPKTVRNLMITMLLGGLWHGAAWTFVVFGGIQGIILAREVLGRRRVGAGGLASARSAMGEQAADLIDWRRDAWRIVVTFHLFTLSGVFFRAATLTQAAHYLAGIFSFRSGPVLGDFAATILFGMLASFTIDIIQRTANSETPVLRWAAVPRGVAFAALGIPIIVFTGGSAVPFIYFQF